MDLGLSGKVALVTGASRGIGRAIAETLAAEGMSVALVARSADALNAVAAGLSTPALVHAVDLREPAAPATAVAATVQHFGRLDVLVNNAGATKRGDFLALTDADWADGFALKFYAAMRASRAAWPHLAAARGAIVNIVGVGGRTGSADFAIGGAVNAAMLNLTKALADRGSRTGSESTRSIRVPSPPTGFRRASAPRRLPREATRRRSPIGCCGPWVLPDSGNRSRSPAWSRCWPRRRRLTARARL